MSQDIGIPVHDSNTRQLRDWDGEHGDFWAEHADYYDRALAGYHPALVAAARVRPGDRILDVGSGSGRLAIDLVRQAPGARALAVDLSASQLAVGRGRAAGLDVEFLQADAQLHDFGTAVYDLVVSRTGTMFFGDPVAAFTNLATATRPGGRLCILVWRDLAANEWLAEIVGALRVGRDLSPPPPGVPGPFAQSDPDTVTSTLSAAGWTDVVLEAHDAPVWLGPDAERGTSWQLGQSAGLLHGLDAARRDEAVANLRALLTAHQTPDGVLLGSGAWLVTGRRTT